MDTHCDWLQGHQSSFPDGLQSGELMVWSSPPTVLQPDTSPTHWFQHSWMSPDVGLGLVERSANSQEPSFYACIWLCVCVCACVDNSSTGFVYVLTQSYAEEQLI